MLIFTQNYRDEGFGLGEGSFLFLRDTFKFHLSLFLALMTKDSLLISLKDACGILLDAFFARSSHVCRFLGQRKIVFHSFAFLSKMNFEAIVLTSIAIVHARTICGDVMRKLPHLHKSKIIRVFIWL